LRGANSRGEPQTLPALPIPENLIVKVAGKDLETRTKVNIELLGKGIFVYIQIEWSQINDAVEYWIEADQKNHLPLALLYLKKSLALYSSSNGIIVDGFNTEALKILLENLE
jgi:hypothetical protein